MQEDASGRGGWRRAAALFSVLLASCSSTTEPSLELERSPWPPPAPPAGCWRFVGRNAADDQSAAQTITGEGDAELPEQVAALPGQKPGDENPAAEAPKPPLRRPKRRRQRLRQLTAAEAADRISQARTACKWRRRPEEWRPDPDRRRHADAPAIEPKKKSFLSSFFGASPASAAPAPVDAAARPSRSSPLPRLNRRRKARQGWRRLTTADMDALPGVRQTALFEIKRKSGIDDDSDVDLHEDEDGPPVLLASAAGLARLAPNGLLKQRETVDIACLKPKLVRMLKKVERHFGKKMVVTSGYRSPAYNRKVRGAKKSQHMYCAAVDVQLPGVSKWELAKFVRAMPGRGGVGTYCHTKSVHIDVGPERDWNWRCGRRN